MNKHNYIPSWDNETLLFPLKKAKTLLLTGLTFIFFLSLTTTAHATDCTVTDDCVDFTYLDKHDNGNGTTAICFEIKNNCNKALSYIAFAANGNAVGPADGSIITGPSGISYYVENPTNNPFPGAIKFETIGEGIKNGATEEFCFDVPTSIAGDLNSIQIQVKAANQTYTVVLDFSDCQPPICINIPAWGGGAAGVNGNDVNYPASNTTVCNGAPFTIENVVAPSGGSGALEVAWIKCSSPSGICTDVFTQMAPYNVGQIFDQFLAAGGYGVADPSIGSTCWEFVGDGDADDLSLNVSGISSTTCFVRCVRRAGCEPFTGEGNIITVGVENCISPLTRDNDQTFEVFPNPARDYINVNLSNFTGKQIQVVIYNNLGVAVYAQKLQEVNTLLQEISTSTLDNGVYTTVIRSKDQQILSSRRFIINK
jgi:hypothetical protein